MDEWGWRGFVHGNLDKHASEPEESPVTPEDLTATNYYLLGIDPKAEVRDLQDRPPPVSSGKLVMEVVA